MILRTCLAALAVCLAAKADDVRVSLDVIRFQAEGSTLRVLEGMLVRNDSAGRRPFEVQLPAGARLNSAVLQLGDGRRFRSRPNPATSGRYAFQLGPGGTRLGLDYSLPYAGETAFEIRVLYASEQVVVVVPETMTFRAQAPGLFRPVPGRPANFRQTGALTAGQVLAFGISGKGSFADLTSAPPQPQSTPQPVAAPPRRTAAWVLPGSIALVLAAAVAGLRSHRQKRIHHVSTANLMCS